MSGCTVTLGRVNPELARRIERDEQLIERDIRVQGDLEAAERAKVPLPRRAQYLAMHGYKPRQIAAKLEAKPAKLWPQLTAKEAALLSLAWSAYRNTVIARELGWSRGQLYRRVAAAEAKLEPLSPPRRCGVPGCVNMLPANATRRRRYCDEHAASRARVARFRAKRAV
jgi:hypothetical protein